MRSQTVPIVGLRNYSSHPIYLVTENDVVIIPVDTDALPFTNTDTLYRGERVVDFVRTKKTIPVYFESGDHGNWAAPSEEVLVGCSGVILPQIVAHNVSNGLLYGRIQVFFPTAPIELFDGSIIYTKLVARHTVGAEHTVRLLSEDDAGALAITRGDRLCGGVVPNRHPYSKSLFPGNAETILPVEWLGHHLSSAAKVGDLNEVIRLVGRGATSDTAFIKAIEAGHLDIVTFLLDQGAVASEWEVYRAIRTPDPAMARAVLAASNIDIGMKRDTLIREACLYDRPETVRMLLSIPTDAPITSEPMLVACRAGHVVCVMLLLADKDYALVTKGCLPNAIANGHMVLVELLLADGRLSLEWEGLYGKGSALIEACKGDFTDLAMRLLDYPGVNIAGDGGKALHYAAKNGNLALVNAIMARPEFQSTKSAISCAMATTNSQPILDFLSSRMPPPADSEEPASKIAPLEATPVPSGADSEEDDLSAGKEEATPTPAVPLATGTVNKEEEDLSAGKEEATEPPSAANKDSNESFRVIRPFMNLSQWELYIRLSEIRTAEAARFLCEAAFSVTEGKLANLPIFFVGRQYICSILSDIRVKLNELGSGTNHEEALPLLTRLLIILLDTHNIIDAHLTYPH